MKTDGIKKEIQKLTDETIENLNFLIQHGLAPIVFDGNHMLEQVEHVTQNGMFIQLNFQNMRYIETNTGEEV